MAFLCFMPGSGLPVPPAAGSPFGIRGVDSAPVRKGASVPVRKKLRLASLCMFAAAAVFVLCALSNPTLGRTVMIGPFTFGVEQWRICYALYVLVMAGLFVASFLVKGDQPAEKGPKRPE